jgi:hypothetical protein
MVNLSRKNLGFNGTSWDISGGYLDRNWEYHWNICLDK